VPTIFPAHPKHLQVKKQTPRRILKRAAPSNLPVRNNKKRKIAALLSHIHADHSYPCTFTQPSTEEQLQEKSQQLKEMSEQLQEARKKLSAVRKRNVRLEKTVTSLEKLLKDLKANFNVQDHVLDMLKQSGSEITDSLFNRMAKNVSSQTTSRAEYPAALRSFALTLHFYSPKAYR
jgi:DNA repair exonuclease SbcCD ATPase subunit